MKNNFDYVNSLPDSLNKRVLLATLIMNEIKNNFKLFYDEGSWFQSEDKWDSESERENYFMNIDKVIPNVYATIKKEYGNLFRTKKQVEKTKSKVKKTKEKIIDLDETLPLDNNYLECPIEFEIKGSTSGIKVPKSTQRIRYSENEKATRKKITICFEGNKRVKCIKKVYLKVPKKCKHPESMKCFNFLNGNTIDKSAFN